ncbi:MAG TPA: TonB family protein [Polyangia bacterium]|nr:TonB family protein [Polyangia bacterium]
MKRGLAAVVLCALAAASSSALAQPVATPTGTPTTPPPAAAPAQLDKPPKLLRFVEAEPPAALAERRQVDVVLGIDVDERGKVTALVVLDSGGAEFDEAALAAVRQFEFAPGESAGKPVPVRITYRYRFLYKPPAPPPAPPADESSAPTAPPVDSVPVVGRVLRQGDRQPLGGLTIAVDDDPALETTTNADGRFQLPAVPVGMHTMHVVGPDIARSDFKVTLKHDKQLSATWYVTGRERYSSRVRAQRAVVETVEQSLSGDEMRHIPGTQGDTLKAVQNLPGVARAPFGGGQIIVWGSSPQDTRTYVDGVYIPTLFHFGGLRSTVNSEMVDGLQFLPGGYGVDHGRGMGGVIEVETRAPRKDGFHGFVQLDLIDGSLMLEGPITKNLSFAIAARRSWIDAILPIFTSNNFQLSPVYYDYQAKLRWRASSRDDVDVFIFGSDDVLKLQLKGGSDPSLQAAFASHTFYHRILARWQHRFASRGTLMVTPSIGYDVPFEFKAAIANALVSVNVSTFEYNLRTTFRQPLTRSLRLDVGIDAEGNRYYLSANAPQGGEPREGSSGAGFGSGFVSDKETLDQLTLAPYFALDFSPIKSLHITPQMRFELYNFAGYQTSPYHYDHFYYLSEPRLSARYQINRWASVKLALGVYHQPPDPPSFLRQFGNPAVISQYAWHYVVGADFDPTTTLHIEVEGFYKDLRNLIVNGEKVGDPTLVNDGIGRVYGGELLVRQELFKGFFGWVSYTLSRSERKDHPDEPWRVFQYDQTHILTIIGSYKFGRGYQVGVRFRYVTGNPYTPVVGSFYDSNANTYTPQNGPIYSGRLGSFNQLDVRFDKKWTFNRWALSLYLDVQNVYNASNPEGYTYSYDYTQRQSISGLPFLPVLGIKGDF